LRAALRIAWEALLFRLRRREANNILTSLSLAVAFHLPFLDLAFRALFSVLLNLFVYLMNDYYDIELDLASPQKDQAKARFMDEHRGAAIGALLGLALLLLVMGALHSSLLVVALLANTAVGLIYSGWLKRWPLADLVLMAVWGASMALVGLPIDALPASVRSLVPAGFGLSGIAGVTGAAASALTGWKLVGLLALLCSAFEMIQVVRDEPGDRTAGIVTTGVLLGAGAAWVFRGLVLVAAIYACLALHSIVPGVLILAGLLPLTPAQADRTWDMCRVLFGSVWLALLVLLHLGRLG
jgi:4-hydroxybenzoate polyprenyltransferase